VGTALLLLAHKCDVNSAEKDGYVLRLAGKTLLTWLLPSWSPLHVASQRGYLDFVKLLVQNNADQSLRQADGWAALHIAVGNGHVEIAKYLVLNGSDINWRLNRGGSALHVLSDKNFTEMATMLINHGANINWVDEVNQTPLHYAIHNERTPENCASLIALGANLNAEDKSGSLPLDISENPNFVLDIIRAAPEPMDTIDLYRTDLTYNALEVMDAIVSNHHLHTIVLDAAKITSPEPDAELDEIESKMANCWHLTVIKIGTIRPPLLPFFPPDQVLISPSSDSGLVH